MISDISQFRVGNFVNYFFDQIEIDSICQIREQINLPDNEWESGIPLNKIRPIELNQQWLLNFGFKKKESKINKSFERNVKRNIYLLITDINTPNSAIFLKQDNDVVCIYNFDYDKKIFVHELQNLYYSLARENLDLIPVL